MLQHAIIGGTFDHLHKGHEAMLFTAFATAEKVTIGITSSAMTQHKAYAHQIEAYGARSLAVKNFLSKNGFLPRAEIIILHDKYGSILSDPTIQAVIVSPATRESAEIIVAERRDNGLSNLDIIQVPFVMADDHFPISSERIRRGVINREGFSYLTYFTGRKSISVSDSVKSDLQKPFGTIYQNVDDALELPLADNPVITVGDIVSTTFLQTSRKPDLAFIDLKTQRKEIDSSLIKPYITWIKTTINNPPGTINPEVAKFFTEDLLSSQCIIRVEGEEDLIALPAILLSPLGSYVVYGQSEVGIVVVEVTEETKKNTLHILRQCS